MRTQNPLNPPCWLPVGPWPRHTHTSALTPISPYPLFPLLAGFFFLYIFLSLRPTTSKP